MSTTNTSASTRQRHWLAWDIADFKAAPHNHDHDRRLTKAELAAHLTKPHKQLAGGWLSNAGPVSEIMKWRRDEIERTHAEYHADA